MRIAIIGTGYVGLVTGVCLASKGHSVICSDIDKTKIELLDRGIIPIYENGLEELLEKSRKNIVFSSDLKEACRNSEVIMICVGTPEKSDGSANTDAVYQAADFIVDSVCGNCTVVVKSTVPIGTNDELEKYICEKVKDRNIHIDVVSNPEFLSQGTAVNDTLNGYRIVIGAENDTARDIMKQVYRDFDMPVLCTDRKSAEMIKYASNDFLALKISYINEIANLCELIGANIDDVSRGMGYDERIGSKFLQAGTGYGGSCFPKDTKALHWMAALHEYEIKTIKATIEVNQNQKLKLVRKAKKYYSSLKGVKIAVLGLTFKPGTDDLREAPSLDCMPILLEDGAEIRAWDPVGIPSFKRHYPDEINYCQTISEALDGAELCLIFTQWDEIKQLKPDDYISRMSRAVIIDGRNCYDLDSMKDAPLIYDSIGRITVNNL